MKFKHVSLAATLAAVVLILSGCGGNSSSSSSQSSSKQTTTQTSNSKKSSSENDKKSDALWNSSKDKKLQSFIEQWAPTMHQSYNKYDGKHELKVSTGPKYPADLNKVKVEGTNNSIGWSKDGNGQYDYNVVAIYNYDCTTPPTPNHITYFFAFSDGKPVALVDQSRDGTPDLQETQNTDVKDSFARIATGEKAVSSNNSSSDNSSQASSSSSSNNKNSTSLVQDPKKIGIMVRQLTMPGDDLTKEQNLGVYTASGYYWIGTGTSVSNVGFKIDGNTIHYYLKDVSSDKPTSEQDLIEHTISLQDLQNQFYSTSQQKQLVDQVANGMGSIESND